VVSSVIVTVLPSEGGAEANDGEVSEAVMNRSKAVAKIATSLGFIISARPY